MNRQLESGVVELKKKGKWSKSQLNQFLVYSSSRNDVISHLYEVNDSVYIAMALLN